MARTLLLAVVTTIHLLPAQAAVAPAVRTERSGFLAKTIDVTGTTHRYVVYVPPGYTADRTWPLVLFLNGAGECGTDGWKQVAVGLGPAIMADVARWPFVVLFPQKPDRRSAWQDHEAMVLAMLGTARAEFRIDEKRLFLTGLSQGGHGTWVLGAQHADLWAAIAPVCGYGDPQQIAPKLAKTPVWCFHGEDDKTVPVQQSKDLCAAVAAAGGNAQLTLYPKVGHNSWDKAYRDELLPEWFLAAPPDRGGIRYLADLDLVTGARLTLRDDASSDGGPPFQWTTTHSLTLDRGGLTWHTARVHRDAAKDGDDPAPREGTLERRAGRQFIAERLQQLRAGRVFQLPPTIVPAPPAGAVMAWHEYTLDLELEGKPGVWRMQRFVPRFAAFDPQFAEQVRALAACAEAIAALK